GWPYRALQHCLRLTVQCVADAMDVLGERIGRQVSRRKEAHIVALVTGHALAADDAADETEDDLIIAWGPTVDPRQPLYSDLKPRLLARLADHAFPWRLAWLHATWLAPPVTVGAMYEQDVPRVVEDGGKDADLHAHRTAPSLPVHSAAS